MQTAEDELIEYVIYRDETSEQPHCVLDCWALLYTPLKIYIYFGSKYRAAYSHQNAVS